MRVQNFVVMTDGRDLGGGGGGWNLPPPPPPPPSHSIAKKAQPD